MEVRLISYTPDPLGVISFARGLMRGEHRIPSEFSYEEKKQIFIDCTKTALFTPFEFVNFVFDFIDVTRAFTHQLVRTRTASYVQESLRFSVKKGEQFKYLDIGNEEYKNCMRDIQKYYEKLLESGCSQEDARGILPANIYTSICMRIDYRNLISMCESRLCYQTQEEHRKAMEKVKQLVTSVESIMGDFLNPSCFHNGFCSWESSLDRKCPLQKKFPFRSEILKQIKLRGKIL